MYFLMGFLIFWLCFGMAMCNESEVNKKYDVRNYFNSVYCEEATVGVEKIKKCWKLVEIKVENQKEKN